MGESQRIEGCFRSSMKACFSREGCVKQCAALVLILCDGKAWLILIAGVSNQQSTIDFLSTNSLRHLLAASWQTLQPTADTSWCQCTVQHAQIDPTLTDTEGTMWNPPNRISCNTWYATDGSMKVFFFFKQVCRQEESSLKTEQNVSSTTMLKQRSHFSYDQNKGALSNQIIIITFSLISRVCLKWFPSAGRVLQ